MYFNYSLGGELNLKPFPSFSVNMKLRKPKIKKGTLEDLAKAVPIQDELFKTQEMMQISSEEYMAWAMELADTFTVAKTRKVVGYALSKQTPCFYIQGEHRNGRLYTCKNPCKECKKATLIADIGVKKGWQRKGVGTKLLEEIVKEANENGRKKIFLQSWIESQGNSSYNFFTKNGFKEQIRIDNYYPGGGGTKILCKKLK